MRVLLHSKSAIVLDVPDFQRETEGSYADADLTAEQAGRLCYLSGHRPNPKTAKNADYLLNICNQRHYSVLGHAFASVYIEGISRNCTHEIIRHRWFTFSEVSQRYVDSGKFELILHPGLKDGELSDFALGLVGDSAETTQGAYDVLVDELVGERGLGRKEARQAARGILPGGTETKILMSGNLRAWRDFLAQRLAPGADPEIQTVARAILLIMKKEFPNSFQDFDLHGLITTERLVQRALSRRDRADATSPAPSRSIDRDFVHEVREILDKGLWVLQTDPWKEDVAGSTI